MRILVLSELYPPQYKGGHEIRFKILADRLAKKGHDVFVLTSKYGHDGRSVVDGGVLRMLHCCESGNAKGLRKRLYQVKNGLLGILNYFIAEKVIKRVKPDIVYAGRMSLISLYPLRAIKRLGIPIVHHVGNYDFPELVESCILEGSALKRFYRKMICGFRNLDGLGLGYIITVSEAVKKQYVESGFPEQNISVIHARGVPRDLIVEKTAIDLISQKRTLKLLCVGRIARPKGVHVAIDAVKYLVDHLSWKEILFDIIGEGDTSYVEYLNNLVEKLQMTSYVKFRKTIPHEDIFQEYRKYHILLFPSIWEEPFSGVLIEAMSQGLPIIATKSGGTPELITDGWNGLLVTPGDPVGMAEGIKKLIENPSLAQRMAINGIDLISKEYNIDDITERIERYLIDVVSKAQKMRPSNLASSDGYLK